MDKRLALLTLLALVIGIATPLVTYLLFSVSEIITQTRIQPIPTVTVHVAPTAREVEARGGFSNYTELVKTLSTTLNYKKLTSSLTGVFEYPEVVPLISALREARSFVPVATTTPQQQTTGARISWTNVQVAGIDEPDIAKTNGELVVVASSRGVYIVSAREKRVLGKILVEEEESSVQGLFLQGTKLVIIAHGANKTAIPVLVDSNITVFTPTEYTTVYIVDVSEPEEPKPLTKVQVSGSLISARLLGDIVYVVTNQLAVEGESRILVPLVDLRPVNAENIVLVGALGEVYTNILAVNITELKYSVKSMLMPTSSRLYMSYDRLYVISTVQPSMIDAFKYLVEALVKVLPLNISSQLLNYIEKGDFLGAREYLLEYVKSLDKPEKALEEAKQELEVVELTDTTHVYVFTVKGLDISYTSKVIVEGTVLDQFAVEEWGEHFIVATTVNYFKIGLHYFIETPTAPSAERSAVVHVCRGAQCTYTTIPVKHVDVSGEVRVERSIYMYPYLYTTSTDNRVYTISLKSLEVKGVLRELAPGERVYAARLVKNTLFLVTFRQVDPLFAIDLSDPEKPRVLGYLKVPGFSEYLHPLPGDVLLGIGREGPLDLKISLFDVKNPVNMSEVAKIVIEGASSPALYDHHAVTVDLDYSYVYVPLIVYKNAWGTTTGIAVVFFEDNTLQLKTILGHSGVTRSLYIDNELYTISPSSIRVFNIETLELISEIPLR